MSGTKDNGATLALMIADEHLAEIEAYFADKADIRDCDDAGTTGPNDAMKLEILTQSVRATLARIVAAQGVSK